MQQYLDLIKEIKEEGVQTPNRTGVDSIKIDGAMMKFDLRKGFPAVTTKPLAFKSVVGELCAFLRASRSAANFRELGCKVWDGNANAPLLADGSPNPWISNPFRKGEDDLGPVYGVQWREWPGYKIIPEPSTEERPAWAKVINKITADGWKFIAEGDPNEEHPNGYAVYYKEIDQLGDCIRTIIKNPDGRRILFHGWNPAVLDEVALPACHLLYQFLPDSVNNRLNMSMYIRSNDVGLGSPFNIAEGAALMHLVAHMTDMDIGRMTYFVGDAHIYVDQLDYLNEQLTKEPLPLPTLKIGPDVPNFLGLIDKMDPDSAIGELIQYLGKVKPEDFILENYQHHTLKTPRPKMAV